MKQDLKHNKIVKNIAIFGLVFMVFLSGVLIGTRLGQRGLASFGLGMIGKGTTNNVADFADFWRAWDAVIDHYDGQVDTDKMIKGAIAGMVASLGDPYTTFLTADDVKLFEDDLSGTISGIGAEVGIRNDRVSIISPIDDSPAKKAGIKSGDVILEIDGESTEGMPLPEAISKIRGEAGTKVTLLVKRGDSEKTLVIIREKFTVDNIKSEIKEGNIGYISIARFDENTATDLRSVLEDFKTKGVKKIILDLRDNPGGYLDQAVDVASEFVPSGIIVTEKNEKKGEKARKYSSDGAGVYTTDDDLRLVVLVNGGSASASEIVAGAIQDHEKGEIVGEKTYGKGSVQEMISLLGGTKIKVTVAHWYTPNGRNITKEGIAPDTVVALTEADYNAGRDPQLEKALLILKK